MVFDECYPRELNDPACATPIAEHCSRFLYMVGVVARRPNTLSFVMVGVGVGVGFVLC